MMEYADYLPIARRIFYEYAIPRVGKKSKDYILELYPCSVDGSAGLSIFPKQVFIYIETIRQKLRAIGIAQVIEKDYVLMVTTLTMIHELLHLEQDISMCYYMMNEDYMKQMEAQVEYEAMSILKNDARMLEERFGFFCNFSMIQFQYSGTFQVYHQAGVKEWYWNTMINSILRDYTNGPKMLEKLQYDMQNDFYVDIVVAIQDISGTNCPTCLVKADGEYLMSNIPYFADLVHGFCSRWTGYRVSVITRDVPRRDGMTDLAIVFTVSDCTVSPMLFGTGV